MLIVWMVAGSCLFDLAVGKDFLDSVGFVGLIPAFAAIAVAVEPSTMTSDAPKAVSLV